MSVKVAKSIDHKNGAVNPTVPSEDNKENTVIKLHIWNQEDVHITPSPLRRNWFPPVAYMCTPMVVANQWGWSIINPESWFAWWNGGDRLEDLVIQSKDHLVSSHFGFGIATTHIQYYIETPPGISLMIRPVPNFYIDGIVALDGVVESDWHDGSFTLNFKMTRPNFPVVYPKGAPLVQLLPYPREMLENVVFEITSGTERDERIKSITKWNEDRADLLKVNAEYSMNNESKLNRDLAYRRGIRHDGKSEPVHKPELSIKLATVLDIKRVDTF